MAKKDPLLAGLFESKEKVVKENEVSKDTIKSMKFTQIHPLTNEPFDIFIILKEEDFTNPQISEGLIRYYKKHRLYSIFFGRMQKRKFKKYNS